MTETTDRQMEHRRMVEAILFASEQPLSPSDIAERMPEGVEVDAHIEALIEEYSTRGVNLVLVADKYMFRTASDLSFLLRKEVDEPRKLSRAAVETLSIIAYHQPVTRAEIEDIRGVTISKGTLDVLIEAGWVKLMGRRKTPGRPVTYGTTDEFLIHFGIESIKDLPGLKELKAAGLLDTVDVALDKMGGIPEPGKSTEDEEDDNQIDLEEAIAKSEREAAEKIRQERDLQDEEIVEEELQAAPSASEENVAVEEPTNETTQLGLLL
ncbi:SMC-Scp complex subunit ScpB [Kordiimonas sp. SCSIO 12603]|uniref:SMC-Scp complex subunit ScpB n=1 Tax=Kordiimonas sp. SCSIO 12603 TaxID=2829596 RepID=UPI0021045BC9|nr:SMC-Scp complex subunit ScpB [Kordiimonas sp. SCSIO 12603]